MALQNYSFQYRTPGMAAPNYGGGVPPSGNINSANLAYVRGGISSDPTAGVTADLLNPEWGPAVYDTEKRGAELAVGGGYSGSPLAGYQTARMRAADIERRAQVANNLLQGAYSRIPNPANQENLLQLQQQQGQFDRRLAEEQRQFDEQQQLREDQYRNPRGPGRSGYNPLPQYMMNRDRYELTPWGPGQSGPTGQTERYYY